MSERRTSTRRPLNFYFNKFLHGYPYLCRTVDLSTAGILVETFTEPEYSSEAVPLELRLPNDVDSIWVMARPVRRIGTRQALEFQGLSKAARHKLERCLQAGEPGASH
jgi:hypothetical protein